MKLKVNGFEVEAEYSETEQTNVLMPLLQQLTALREQKQERIIVYLAAPPGTGKTTLSQYLEIKYKRLESPYTFQSISIDGFHYKNHYLKSHQIEVEGKNISLKNIKGSPETFDLMALRESCLKLSETAQVDWPIYDRKLHDVSPQRLIVDADIVLIEGNWLLLDETGWRDLKAFADRTMFIDADEGLLKKRLIERKMMGGLSKEAAETFYEESDGKNVLRVLENHTEPDLYWKMQKDGAIVAIGNRAKDDEKGVSQ